MNTEQTLQLLKESILTPGKYNPSENFKTAKSVALELNGKPIILLGQEDDPDSHDIAGRLISNSYFLQLINNEYGFIQPLKKTIINNVDVCPNPVYDCITKSEQGLSEDGQGNGELVAVILDKNALGLGICVSSAVMQCFYPASIPLSAQVELNA